MSVKCRYIFITQKNGSRHTVRVSPSDFDLLSRYSWHVTKAGWKFYARTTLNGRNILMHRMLMIPGPAQVVDHVDDDGLNNMRENLRLCSNAENTARQRRTENSGSSRFRGVSWNRRDHNWRVSIRVRGSSHFLGHYDEEQDAARAYDAKAVEMFGEFARLNFTRPAALQAFSPSKDA